MKKSFFLLLVTAAMFGSLVLFFSGCSGSDKIRESISKTFSTIRWWGDSGSDETNVIKIGAVLPVSSLGTSMKAGLDLAVSELNKNSDGVKYEWYVEDAPEDKDVLSAYNALKLRGKMSCFVTTGSSYSMSLKPKVIENNELLFCVASLPAITADGTYNVYKIGNSSVDESGDIVQNIQRRGGSTVMFYPHTEYGIPFLETISQNLDDCIGIVYEEEERDFHTLISDALKSKPDNIVAIGFSPALGTLIKTIRELGFSGPILSNTGFISSDVIEASGDAAYGVKYIDYDFDNSSATQSRNEYIRDKFEIDFTSISFLAYSIPYFLKSAEDDLLRQDYKKASESIRSHDTLSIADEYPYLVFHNGDIKPSLTMKEYNNGKK